MFLSFASRLILLFIIVLSCSFLQAQDRLSGKSFATRSMVIARHGMVASNNPLATQIGIDILKRGGSAVDAAIAVNAFLGVADPGMNGIGGDLMALVWNASDKKLYGLNASGKSPASLSLDTLAALDKSGRPYYKGALSITTPGCVDGWVELHRRFGKLAFAQLLQPAIRYAREGVPITQETADFFHTVEADFQKEKNPSFQHTYFINGRFPHVGEIFRNTELAAVLEEIAQKGRAGFYEGKIAAAIAASVKAQGGYLSKEDLAQHHGFWVEPVSINYRGYDVWELPPNCQGMAALQILNILEGYHLKQWGYGSPEHLHYFTEAKKLAYEDLAHYYGDPTDASIPIASLLSKTYADERRQLIASDKAGVYDPGTPLRNHTVYLTVADSAGNMISLIQSLSGLFGSGVVPEGLGFALQNRGGDFVLEKGHVNTYASGKRPFTTIMPGFVTLKGQPFLSFGVMGGDMQPQGQVQILLNMIDFGMNVQEAGDAPRIFHDGTTNYSGHLSTVGTTYLESGFAPETIRALIDKGHVIGSAKGLFGGYQAIMVKDGVYYGASDARKDGQAGGY